MATNAHMHVHGHAYTSHTLYRCPVNVLSGVVVSLHKNRFKNKIVSQCTGSQREVKGGCSENEVEVISIKKGVEHFPVKLRLLKMTVKTKVHHTTVSCTNFCFLCL